MPSLVLGSLLPPPQKKIHSAPSSAQLVLESYFQKITDPHLQAIKTKSLLAAEILKKYHFLEEAECCYSYPLIFLKEFEGKLDGKANEKPTGKDQKIKEAEFEKITLAFPPDLISLWKAFFLLKNITEDITSQEKLAENIRQLLVAASFDLRVIFIRLGFWLADLQNLHLEKPEEAKQMAQDTLEIYSKIAHRLGLYLMKSEMEHLSFQWLKPLECKKIEAYLEEQLQGRMNFYEDLRKEYQQIFAKEGIPFHFSYRTKEIYSIYQKSLAQNLPVEKLFDVIACRFLVHTKEECYKVLALVHSHATPIPGRLKDYIQQPKINGYQSLHTTVKEKTGMTYEVQVRTLTMHHENEYGLAAHWSYKEKQKNKTKDETNQIAWLRTLVQNYGQKTDFQESFDDFKRELSANSIYVFTPQGKMIRLPKGASVVDFAYAIHSAIGNACVGAKVNGVFSPIRRVLESGQQVEIITQSNSKPNRDWLQFCLTNKAVYHIRNAIKQESGDSALILGGKILTKAFETAKLSTVQLENHPQIQKYLKKKSFSQFKDLLTAIGFGFIDIQDLMNSVQSAPKEKRPYTPKALLRQFSQLALLPKAKVANTMGIPTRIALCCQPSLGDEIVGLISNSGLIKIHRGDCEKIHSPSIKEGQLVRLHWEKGEQTKCTLELWFIFPTDTVSLNIITNSLAAMEIQIIRSRLEAYAQKEGFSLFHTFLELNQMEMIDKLKKRLQKFPQIQILQESPLKNNGNYAQTHSS